MADRRWAATIVVGLMLLFAGSSRSHAARQAAFDRAPGWVIILAADYQGSQGPLNRCVQRDAARAYKFMVCDWKVPPDHVLLLAQGNEIQKMVQDGDLPGRVGGQSLLREDVHRFQIDPNRARTQDLLALLRQNASGSLSRDIDTVQNFFAPERMLPYVADPTSANFKAALDVADHLATTSQFVALVISSHYKPGSLVALSDTDSLQDKDLWPPSRRSERRLLVMDATKLGESEPESSFTPDLSEAINDLRNAYIVFAASDGRKPSWPLSGKQDVESIFLRSVFDVLKVHPFGDLQSIFRQLSRRYEKLSLASYKPVPNPTLSPGGAQSLRTITASWDIDANRSPSVTWTLVTNEVSSATVHDKTTGEEWGVVHIGNHMIDMIPGIPDSQEYSGQNRADIVAKRLNTLLSLKTLTQEELKQISPGRVGDQIVISAPARLADRVPFLITVDPKLAGLRNEQPEQVALALADSIQKDIVLQYAHSMAEDEPTEKDLFDAGMRYFAESSYTKAENSLEQATQKAPEYIEAYLQLAEIYLVDAQPQKARLTLQRCHTLNAKDLSDPEYTDRYERLAKALSLPSGDR